jgi:pimeloyl-ACP methyl ester carboxylesterase
MARIRRGYVQLDSGLVHLRYGGRGAPLVVVHDAGQSSATAERHEFLARLADRFRITAPDLPGHGRSDPVSAPPTLAALATLIQAVAHELGDTSIRILGIGLGALIGAQLARSAPSAVQALVCAFPPETPAPPGALAGDGSHLLPPFRHYLARLADQPGGLAEATALTLEAAEAGEAAARAFALRRATAWEPLFAELEMPALLLAALGDPQFDRLSDLATGNARLDLALAPPGLVFGAFDPAALRATVEDVLW